MTLHEGLVSEAHLKSVSVIKHLLCVRDRVNLWRDVVFTHIQKNPKVMDGMFSVPSHQFRETSESEPMVSELYS